MSRAPDLAYTAKRIKGIYHKAIADFDRRISRILAVRADKRTFENTVVAFDLALAELDDATRIPQFLADVSPDETVREASEELASKINAYMVNLRSRQDIYSAIKRCSGMARSLGPEEELLLKKTMRDFERNGLGLKGRKKSAANEAIRRLAELSRQFQKSLRESSDSVSLSRKELAGLPTDYVSGLRRTPDGRYQIGMSYPEYVPFMEKARDRNARRRLFRVYGNRCAETNVRLLEEALRLRRDLANLMGYRSFAEYVLEDRMAGDVGAVNSFLARLKKRLSGKARGELRALAGINGAGSRRIEGWDLAFCMNTLSRRCFRVNHEKIREYFPLDGVLRSVLDIFGGVFGVSFRPVKTPVWHKEVKVFEVRSLAGGALGLVYFDLFPRQGKFTHGMCAPLRVSRGEAGGPCAAPAFAVVANFSPPSASRPSLLRFNEVETLFHELGHAVYGIFSRPKFHRFISGNSPLDFVEVPSMLLQSWAYEPEVLRKISGHYKCPGKKVPAQMVGSLLRARTAFSGLTALRLVALSCVDMRYHSGGMVHDTTKVYREMVGKISGVPVMEGTHPQASLIHLMPGYAAGLYGYLWADVIAADMFSEFKRNGLENPAMGEKYRLDVLFPAAGGDPREMVCRFLGRPFSEEAYVRRIGSC